MTLPALDPAEFARDAWPAGDETLTVRWVSANGARARVIEAGSAHHPAVVMLPGWGCTAYTFRDNIPALASAGWRVVVIEPPGQGWSEKPVEAERYALPQLARSVRAVLESLRLGAGPIIGQSLGGAIALQLALDVPRRVTQLALWSPIGFGCTRVVAAGALLPPKAAPLLERVVGRRLVRFGLEIVYGSARRPSPSDVREYAAPIGSPGYVRAQIELLRNVNWTAMDDESCARITVPVAILGGRADPLVPALVLESAAVRLPRATVRLIAGGGHAINETHSEEVNADTLAFLGAPDAMTRG